MREIKFRVWEPGIRKMWAYDPMWGNRHRTRGGWLCVLPIGEERNYRSFYTDDNRIAIDTQGVVLLQFTGLKDKNGTEIYEGDIVEGKPLIGWSDQDKLRGDVFFQTERGGWKVRVVKTDYTDIEYLHELTKDPRHELEIIGNIYENPELLLP